jgi:hypothetical protein
MQASHCSLNRENGEKLRNKKRTQIVRVDVSSSFTPLSLSPLCVTVKITCEENVFIPSMHVRTEPNFLTFKEPKNRLQGTNSARLCIVCNLYDKPIPTRVLAPIDC